MFGKIGRWAAGRIGGGKLVERYDRSDLGKALNIAGGVGLAATGVGALGLMGKAAGMGGIGAKVGALGAKVPGLKAIGGKVASTAKQAFTQPGQNGAAGGLNWDRLGAAAAGIGGAMNDRNAEKRLNRQLDLEAELGRGRLDLDKQTLAERNKRTDARNAALQAFGSRAQSMRTPSAGMTEEMGGDLPGMADNVFAQRPALRPLKKGAR